MFLLSAAASLKLTFIFSSPSRRKRLHVSPPNTIPMEHWLAAKMPTQSPLPLTRRRATPPVSTRMEPTTRTLSR